MKKKKRVGLRILVISLIALAGVVALLIFQEHNRIQQEQLLASAQAEIEEPVVVPEEIEEVVVEEPEEPEEVIIDKNDPNSYTYEEMNAVFYSSEGASVRDLPHEEGKLVGTMYMDQTVKVLGKCVETGYYKIKINGGEYFVAGDEISEDYYEIPLPLPKEIVQPEVAKDILFIGNSITLHGPAEFWWGNYWGMGATSADLDYVHQTVYAMGYSSYDVMSMRNWEMKDARNRDLNILDSYVANYDYNVVVIFLGENAKGREAHFGEDLVSMMKYIRAFNPDVKIVLMDNFWKYDDIIAAKKKAAQEAGATYCSLSDLWNVSKYQLYTGQLVTCDEVEYEVDSFVAGHPNNSGMAAISEKLVATLQSL